MTAALSPRRRGLPLGTARKVGRGLLASSHAGTRLPIAAYRPGRRALPLRPARALRPSAVFNLPRRASFRECAGSKKAPCTGAFTVKNLLPTSALPASGSRVEASASSQPNGSPGFYGLIIAPRRAFVKGRDE